MSLMRCEKCGRPAPQQTKGKRCANCDHSFGRPAQHDRCLDANPLYRQRWLSMLLHIQQERGYSRLWPDLAYSERFGIWPDHGLMREPIAPSKEVLLWIKTRNARLSSDERKAQKKITRKEMELDRKRHEASILAMDERRRKELGFTNHIASPQQGRNPGKRDLGRKDRRAPGK